MFTKLSSGNYVEVLDAQTFAKNVKLTVVIKNCATRLKTFTLKEARHVYEKPTSLEDFI
jgi:hypothetical protein